MLTYGQALRAIGQDLEGHGALVYDISVNQSEYRIQCDCDLPPPGNLLSLCYTSRFHGQVETHRCFSVNSPESLPGTLRSLGVYADREKGRLLRVANYELLGPEIAYRVEFALPDGSQVENTLSKPALDEITNSLRQQRK